MGASDSLSPLPFPTDKTDREQDKKARKRDGEAGDKIYDPSNLGEDQYERLGREDVAVNPRREPKRMRIA
jgi:hypothetical protein